MEPLIENFDLQEEIIRYLNGEMGDQEKLEFETRVKNDNVLANELQNYHNVMKGIEYWGDMNLKAMIAEVDGELEQQHFFKNLAVAPQKKQARFFTINNVYAVAAAFIGVILFAYLLVYFSKDSGTNTDIYKEFYQTDVKTTQAVMNQLDPSGFIPTNIPVDSIQWALKNYQDGNYKASLSVFERCANEEGVRNLCTYYVALNHLGLNEEQKAMPLLNNLCALPNHELKTGSCWYLALTLIKQGKEDSRIKVLLNEVSADKDSPFSAEADKLRLKWVN